ncbi:MAG: MogA/MoaB family molybdenum cofactor biosynthesis protein [Conexivisphaera sp.]
MHHPTPEVEPVFAVLVTSDSRFEAALRGSRYDDESGSTAARILREEGFEVLGPLILPNDELVIAGTVSYIAGRELANSIIVIGGTGASPRDVSADALEEVCDRALPGFGEAFRALTREEDAAKSILTRSTAGTCGGAVAFAIPGSPAAVEMAVKRLIIPTIRHLLGELRR